MNALSTSLSVSVPTLRLSLEESDMTIEVESSGQLLGRHSEADVRLPTPDVSRKHCRFVYREGEWIVLDLDSLNGTFVNDESIRQSVLRVGDVLRVGNFRFVVEIGAQTVPKSSLAERIFRIPIRPVGQELRRAS